MQLFILLWLVDCLLFAHALLTRRAVPWAFVILFFPGLGALLYIVIELVPEFVKSREGMVARDHMSAAFEPGGRYRELQGQLALVDTIANRFALAEECMKLKQYQEAKIHYEAILKNPIGNERHFIVGLMKAQFALGHFSDVIATFDAADMPWKDRLIPDAHLLYTRALEGDKRDDDAIAHYQYLGNYYPGPEPRVRHARLLRRLGRGDEAREIAKEVVYFSTQIPVNARKRQIVWYDEAQKIVNS